MSILSKNSTVSTQSRPTQETESSPDIGNTVARNTAATLLARGLAQFLSLLAYMKSASYLGDTQWGTFGYLFSTVEIFRAIANFGLDVVALRLVAMEERNTRAILRQVVLLKTLLSMVSMGMIAVFASFYQPLVSAYLPCLVISLGLLPFAWHSSLMVLFQARHRMHRLVFAFFVAGAMHVGAVYFASWLGFGILAFVLIPVVVEATIALAVFLYFRKEIRSLPEVAGSTTGWLGFDGSLSKRLLIQGAPVATMNLLSMIYSRLGVYLLEGYRGMDQVGNLYTAMRFVEPVTAVAGALSTSFLPVFSQMTKSASDPGALHRRFARVSVLALPCTSLMALAITIFSSDLLALVDVQYISASGALCALSWATVFVFQNQLSTSMINAHGKYHWITAIALFNLLVYFVLGVWLVPRYGSTGAGLATLGTEGLNALLQLSAVALLSRGKKAT